MTSGQSSFLVSLQCPSCAGPCRPEPEAVICASCGTRYPIIGGVVSMIPQLDGQKASIQRFWADGAVQRQAKGDPGYAWQDEKGMLANLNKVERNYVRSGLFARELPLDTLKGRTVLEVGCGSGGASLVMSRHGAEVVAGDLALPRCANALRMHGVSSWRDRKFAAVQLDAERLPFPDGSFDAVLSNGVLHHTTDTRRAVEQVRRVLKPGGTAAIMLYSRRSLMYAGLWLYHGILRGKRWSDPDWLSHVSEQEDSVDGSMNPVTRAYLPGEIHDLFSGFSHVETRQDQLAIFSANRFRLLSRALTPLAPWLGWCLYIKAVK